MNAGDTFFVRDRFIDTHLWVVISDPAKDPDRVLMVSMTTYEPYKEKACLLEAGDHPRVTHSTCIAYDEARLIALKSLTALRDGGRLSVQDPVSDALLSRIREGVSRSTRIKFKYVELLLDQGLIE